MKEMLFNKYPVACSVLFMWGNSTENSAEYRNSQKYSQSKRAVNSDIHDENRKTRCGDLLPHNVDLSFFKDH